MAKKAVDLFAGCGGMSLGFQNAGIEILAAFEKWNVAAECYSKNFTHPVYRTDLSEVQEAVEQICAYKPDIIIGGPPCQDFSFAGKRIEAKRASLTDAFADIVASVHPQYFVMENVDRARNSAAYGRAREVLHAAGYGLTEIVLDASLCGVPQKRKRFICIGSIGAEDGFLADHIEAAMGDKELTLREYFSNTLDFEFYYRHPRNYSRRAIFSIDEPAPTMRGVNRPVPQGYPGHPNDACEVTSEIKALTTLERALIQTFPADYKWVGTKTDMEQMIGNAVPVKMAEFVARELLYHIDACESEEIDLEGFAEWLHTEQELSERTEHDTVSRLRRANTMCEMPSSPDAYYVFQLEQTSDFRGLAPAVRSQLKRAVKLYSRFRESTAIAGAQ